MPSRLRSRTDIPVDKIPLEGGDWVMVRRWITAGDRDEMNKRLTKIDMEAGKGEYRTELINRNTALQVLTGWGGPGLCVDDHEDIDGNPLPVEEGHEHRPVDITFDNVSMLHDQDLRKIINHLSRVNSRPVPPSDPLEREMPDSES